MSPLLRQFSINSAMAIVLISVAMMIFFRHVSVEDIVKINERKNAHTAHIVKNYIAHDIMPFSRVVDVVEPGNPLGKEISTRLSRHFEDTATLRVRILDTAGREIVSTGSPSVVDTAETDLAFKTAVAGTLSSATLETTGRNADNSRQLLSSYAPVTAEGGEVIAVIRVDADLTVALDDVNHHIIPVFIALLSGLSLLYVLLLRVVARADRTIKRQHDDLAQRTEELSQALREAEEANAAKSKFFSTMTHEFRTPLNAIIGFSELMLSRAITGDNVPKFREYANVVHESGHHMLELVNDVLDIAEIDAGKRTLQPVEIDLPALLKKSVHGFEKIAADKDVTLTLYVEPPLPQLVADERSIYQIVLNLLSNALKFTDAGDSVSVHVTGQDGATVITVADTGVGIPTDQLAMITEPFFQIKTDPARRDKGTGLGLSIVAELVDTNGGTLDIASEPATGTTVTLRFPARRG